MNLPRMRRNPWLQPILFGLLALRGTASATDWQQVDPGSELRFQASAQGEDFDGGFGRFETRLSLDSAALDSAKLDVVIDLGSVDSANAERDELLVSEDFFAVDQAKQARFSAQQISIGDNGYVAAATLQLKGRQQPVEFRFTFSPAADGQTAVLEGQATLDRLAFDIGSGEWADEDMIGRAVIVHAKVLLRRQ